MATSSSGPPQDQKDFEYQLEAERLAVQQQQGSSQAGWDRTRTYTDPSDGTVYEWDAQRKGWFPKIDDYFLAAYQASYGVGGEGDEATPSGPASTAAPPPQQAQQEVVTKAEPESSGGGGSDGGSRKRKHEETGAAAVGGGPGEGGGGWFEIEEEKNHNIYVSGLPSDITLHEFEEMMSKYGIIMEDDEGEVKLKLYRDRNGEIKGDGLCCYLKRESVALALQLLDGLQLRGQTIRAEKAKFSLKGSYNPALKKKKQNKKNKKTKQSVQEKLLDWRERRTNQAAERKSKFDKVVIFLHAFHPSEFEEEPLLINEIKDDLRVECEKFGVVKKILLFDRHPEGVVSIGFKEAESAAACAQAMNGRWYGGRQLTVTIWDGVTNYQVEETEKEREERLKQWENFLEEDDEEKEKEGEKKMEELSVEDGGGGGEKEQQTDTIAISTSEHGENA